MLYKLNNNDDNNNNNNNSNDNNNYNNNNDNNNSTNSTLYNHVLGTQYICEHKGSHKKIEKIGSKYFNIIHSLKTNKQNNKQTNKLIHSYCHVNIYYCTLYYIFFLNLLFNFITFSCFLLIHRFEKSRGNIDSKPFKLKVPNVKYVNLTFFIFLVPMINLYKTLHFDILGTYRDKCISFSKKVTKFIFIFL